MKISDYIINEFNNKESKMAGKKSNRELKKVTTVCILRSKLDKILEIDPGFNLSNVVEKCLDQWLAENEKEDV